MANRLFYADNLDALRAHVADASVDLVYLDPPFNSNANYNILFKTPGGHAADSQIQAFEDSWHWNNAMMAIRLKLLPSNESNSLLRSYVYRILGLEMGIFRINLSVTSRGQLSQSLLSKIKSKTS